MNKWFPEVIILLKEAIFYGKKKIITGLVNEYDIRKIKDINPLVKKIFEENDIENISDAQNIMKDMVTL